MSTTKRIERVLSGHILKSSLLLLLICCVGRSTTAFAEPEVLARPAPISHVELVQQLGADSYTQREAATTTLIEQGSAARPALTVGTRSTNFEIRSRCRRLLDELDQLTLRRVLEAIRNGQALSETDRAALPFYEVYCRRFGHTPAAQEVYAAYLTCDFRFLSEVERGFQQSERLGIAAGIEQRITRCETLLTVNQNREPADQLLFDDEISEQLQVIVAAIALTQTELGDRGWLGLTRLLFLSKSVQKSIKATSPTGTVRRAILGQCYLNVRSLAAFRLALQLTNDYGCREAGATLARSVFGTADLNLDDQMRGRAVEAIGLAGSENPADLALLIPLLDDQAVLLTGSPTSLTSEVGDAALLAIVRLTKQNPNEYQVGPECRFPSHAIRRESQAKLRRWLVEQRGIEPARLFPSSPTTPAEFLTRALNAVEDEVINGCRFRELTSLVGIGRFQDDRLDVALAGVGLQFQADLFVETSQGAGSLGIPLLGQWGRTFALIRFDNGVRTLSLTAVDTSETGKVIETRIEGTTPEAFALRVRETTGDLTTEISYQQRPAEVELSVREQTNLERLVQYDQTGRATSLLGLRRSEPELFQRGLEPLLKRLKIALPSQ